MRVNVFITIIETRLDLAISLAISINPVFRAGTAGTIGLKRPILCAKKKAVDQLIIIRKNAMHSEIRLKIAFEKNITITKVKRHTRAYIVNYEGTDFALKTEPDESDIEKKIEILMIDFDSSETFESNEAVKKSSAFITDFETMNRPEVLTADLINRFFIYRVGLYFRTKIVPEAVLEAIFEVVFEIVPKIVFEIVPSIENINRAWAFVSIKHYTKERFFEIMIDTETSAYSTAGYGQFLAYSKIIETAINSAKAEAVNV